MTLRPIPPPLLGRWDSASGPLSESYHETPSSKGAPRAACPDSYLEMHGVGRTCDWHRSPSGAGGTQSHGVETDTAAPAGPLGLRLKPPVQNRTMKFQIPRRHLGPPAPIHTTKCMVLGPPGTGTAAPGVPLGLSPKAVPKPDTRFHTMKCKVSDNLGTGSLIHNRRPNVLNCKKP